jgi:primosomal protein N' (replication factor Y)
VLLFLNRRGFAQILQCLACGEPAGCPDCAVTLTWHQRRRALLCHHCGFARAAEMRCTSCGRGELMPLGDGTERVESEVARLFPTARVARLDRDTMGSKGAHGRVLDAWRRGSLDILIGTQMIAKGHDVPGVTVVGVLLADVALNLPDFRAGERAFQLLTQVAGRAGRGDAPGRVIVQTFRPEHHSLLTAADHDYGTFVDHELGLRGELGYPPFYRLAVLRREGSDARATEVAAIDLAARARAVAASPPPGEPAAAPPGGPPPNTVTVRGPAPAPLERLRGRYRWQILVSAPTAAPLNAALRRLLAWWRSTRGPRDVRLVVDVDPVSML